MTHALIRHPGVVEGFIEKCARLGITKEALVGELLGQAGDWLKGLSPAQMAMLTGGAGGLGSYGLASALGAEDPLMYGLGGGLAGAGIGGFGKSYLDELERRRVPNAAKWLAERGELEGGTEDMPELPKPSLPSFSELQMAGLGEKYPELETGAAKAWQQGKMESPELAQYDKLIAETGKSGQIPVPEVPEPSSGPMKTPTEERSPGLSPGAQKYLQEEDTRRAQGPESKFKGAPSGKIEKPKLSTEEMSRRSAKKFQRSQAKRKAQGKK